MFITSWLRVTVVFCSATLFRCTPLMDFPQLENIDTKFVCENDTLFIKCDGPSFLEIQSVYYGRAMRDICANGVNADRACDLLDKKELVKERCNNKQTCTIPPPHKEFFGDHCPEVDKYLNVIYACVRNADVEYPKTTIPTTMPSTPRSAKSIENVTTTPSTTNTTSNTTTSTPRPVFSPIPTVNNGVPVTRKRIITFNPDGPDMEFLHNTARAYSNFCGVWVSVAGVLFFLAMLE